MSHSLKAQFWLASIAVLGLSQYMRWRFRLSPVTILPAVVAMLPFLPVATAQNSTLFLPPTGANVTTIHILDDHGERNIAYYESNGFAVVDGDIAYGTVAELLARVYDGEPRISRRAHSIFQNGPKWAGAKISYKYDSVDTENKVHTYIETAISRWQAKNPFLQFVKVEPPSTKSVSGVVTVTAAECGGCYASVIGYSSNDNLVVNLQQSCGTSTAGCFENEATHEIGHVLGLVHEVKRPDRDSYVDFHCENLMDYATYPNHGDCCTSPTKCCGWACQFTADNSFDHSGPYRTTSIMHYRADSFAAAGLDSLTAVGSNVVPPYNLPEPDIVDYERVCEIYNQQCTGVCGNGIVEPGEECDDGNDDNTDSCSNSCKKQSVCGNGIVEPGEQCDDGNTVSGDGCSSTCQKEAVCGNGILEYPEECDDGNTISHDGCSSTCKKEALCTQCNPIPYPGANGCDITTSCITTYPSGQLHCACRAGFKSSALNSQIELQYKLPFPGQEYRVFVKPGVVCDTLCDIPTGAPGDICTEVPVVSQCDS